MIYWNLNELEFIHGSFANLLRPATCLVLFWTHLQFVSNVIIDWIQKDSDEHKIPQKTCKYFESIFTNANKLLKKS